MEEDMEETISKNFIEQIIEKDIEEGHCKKVVTRFPPEPNGYLHIGHAKSILLNYGLAQEYGGDFHFRFDDTNPTKEKEEYVNSIKEDVEWLGADYHEHIYYASNYFDKMYECAEFLIKKGKAYVCDLNAEQIREYRGTLTEPGKNSPYRDRTPEENLQLFREMKEGKYPDGSKVLRAKSDVDSRGDHAHRHTLQRSGIRGKLPLLRHFPAVFQMRCDLRHTIRVTGEQHILSDLSGCTIDMKLPIFHFFCLLFFQNRCFSRIFRHYLDNSPKFCYDIGN